LISELTINGISAIVTCVKENQPFQIELPERGGGH